MADFPVFSNFVFVKCCFYVLFIVNNVINLSRLIVFRYMFLCVITFFSWTIQLKTSKVGTIPFQVQNESLRQLFFAIAVWQTD